MELTSPRYLRVALSSPCGLQSCNYQVHWGGRLASQAHLGLGSNLAGPGCLTTVDSNVASSGESMKGTRHVAATCADLCRPLPRWARIRSPRQIASMHPEEPNYNFKLHWQLHPESDFGKPELRWARLGPNLGYWGVTWLRPPWVNASGLQLPAKQSHTWASDRSPLEKPPPCHAACGLTPGPLCRKGA